MAARRTRAWALLFLALYLRGVMARHYQAVRREDATPIATIAPPMTTAGDEGKETGASPETSEATRSTQRHTADTTATVITSTSTTTLPSTINGNEPGNSSLLVPSNPIPAGALPLQPRLTPGWGVAGALLLISGIAYTLISIKNAWLHTFFSTAFLSGLSVTVLIVYVMAPPIPAAIEGAYVVAAVVTGVILGGAATVFSEITEGLGCLLGGFCLSMWLLTLRPGGLLASTPPKVIFIAAFSVGSYGFYFSRHTRPYALMGLMSFAGATVTVIGIDCFSKAGLKEFWAYIWDLNKGLFPYGADTYPLTKGIRVEIALTVVFTIIGIISQLKLWRVIQKHRAKKAEEQAEEQRKRDEEEANLGLHIETQNARERRQWETIYGNQPMRSSTRSGDSGVGDVEEEKKARISQSILRRASSTEDDIEMAELPNPDAAAMPVPEKRVAAGLIMTSQDDDSRVIIRVASEDVPDHTRDAASMSDFGEKVWLVNGNGEARSTSMVPPRMLQRLSKPPEPEITPLPFQVPSGLDGYTDKRSSIATYADEDDGAYAPSEKPSRLSMANRLSRSSGNLLRSLSQRSAHSLNTKRTTAEIEARPHLAWAGSTEELVESPRSSSDAQSTAATIDGMSQDGDDYNPPTNNENEHRSIPAVTVDLDTNNTESNVTSGKAAGSEMQLKPPNLGSQLDVRPTSLAETVGTDILDPSVLDLSSGELSKRSSTNHGTGTIESTNQNSNPTDMSAIEATPESSLPSKLPTNKSLTKDRLPSALPRVALSYRTNEWAKHLSAAEAPLPEQLQSHSRTDRQNVFKQEAEFAVPVHIEELQQTPESGVPPTTITRSSSSASNLPQVLSPTYRSVSRVSSYSPPLVARGSSTLAILTGGSSDVPAQTSPSKPTPPNLPQAGHIFRSKGLRKSSEVYIQPIQEENDKENPPPKQQCSPDGSGSSTPNSIPPSPTGNMPIPGVVSYSSPQTLLGRREMFLRNKSQSQLFTTPPIQEDSQHLTRASIQVVPPHSYATTSPYLTQDADDLPLSQRKELIRQSSMLSVNSNGGRPRRDSALNVTQTPTSTLTTQMQPLTAESSNFDSHQPQRRSTLPPQAVRDARLSNFRQSVAAELRAGTPVVPVSGRETPLHVSASTTSLLGPSNGNNEISRTIDQQRNILMSHREQQGQKRDMERWAKERNDRVFEERMRRGDLLDAHREALRRMQGGVKHC